MVSFNTAIEDSPYPSLRDVQKDGIEATINAVDDDGFLVLEGACGTGKTLLSLLPLTSYIKDNSSKYNQVLVVTSVKQQQKIFQEELESVNEERRANDKSSLSAITLVGKQDVCPYVKHDTIDPEDIQSKCESLREGTRDQLQDAEDEEAVAKRIQATAEPVQQDTITRYDQDGTYEYPFDVDEYPEGTCSFYAGYQEAISKESDVEGDYKPTDVIPFDMSQQGVMDVHDLVSKSGGAGMCPHSILGEAIECADVVIGNYMHVFDEKTRNFTEELISEDTLIVVDEAHNLVPRVRGILSNSISLKETFGKGLLELRELEAIVTDSFGEDEYWDSYSDLAMDSTFASSESDIEKAVSTVSGLRKEDFSKITTAKGQEAVCKAVTGSTRANLDTVITRYQSFYTDLYTKLLEITESELSSASTPSDLKFGLRDPTELKVNKISQWLEFKGDMSMLKTAEMFGKSLTALKSFITTELYEDPTVETDIQNLCSFWQKWAEADYKRYFQSIELSERSYQPDNRLIEREWQNEYRTTIELKNCLPQSEIKNTIDSFGGGVLMSATLEPINMYVEETGLSDFDDRTVLKRSYGLRYPEENRETITSPTTKFKHSNRESNKSNGSYNTSNDTRKQYVEAIEATVSSTPGNVLIVMPSYAEAWWAGEVVTNMTGLSRSQVIIDEQSTMQETTKIKEEFFKGGKKVLVTGARGTLTEGVDYTGEKLKGALICGVPIARIDKFNKAVQTTYDEFFEDGFEYAFVLPSVRKARQAIGRVIRGDKEIGVRVLADERYCENHSNWDSVYQYLPIEFRDEATEVSETDLEDTLTEFWNSQS